MVNFMCHLEWPGSAHIKRFGVVSVKDFPDMMSCESVGSVKLFVLLNVGEPCPTTAGLNRTKCKGRGAHLLLPSGFSWHRHLFSVLQSIRPLNLDWTTSTNFPEFEAKQQMAVWEKSVCLLDCLSICLFYWFCGEHRLHTLWWKMVTL